MNTDKPAGEIPDGCPFCGVTPHVCRGITPGTYKEDPAHGTICCENDLCGVNPSVDYYNGIEQGIYVWNTRADKPDAAAAFSAICRVIIAIRDNDAMREDVLDDLKTVKGFLQREAGQ